jgi:flagellin
MIAGLSSSVSTALRTAGDARARMDQAARKIATGKDVASARDDGARFVQANALKSQKADWEARDLMATRLDLAMQYTKGVAGQHLEIAQKLRQTALAASALPAGSQARVALQKEWDALIAAGKSTAAGINPGYETPDNFGSDVNGVGVELGGMDSYWAGNRYAAYSDTSAWTGHYSFVNAGWGITVALDTVDIANGSPTHLSEAINTSAIVSGEQYGTWNTGWMSQIGADERVLDTKRADIARQRDRIDTAIGSLTDADLGKESTARAQAQIRQELAFATVRQALDAYGSYAGGLLGNVQRTQRGVLA